jgi:DNA-3-methyladenine glycosylase
MRLSSDYYLQPDSVLIAQNLLGKILCTHLDGNYCVGIITETEAYTGVADKASHAYGNRLTNRTVTMYQKGGIAYVYLCYGIHYLFNVVTNIEGIPHATLIRAIEPIEGISHMLIRRNKKQLDYQLAAGPGYMCKAMGTTTKHNGLSLLDNIIWIEDRSNKISKKQIIASPRVGVGYAQEDALLPYRFRINNNPYVSLGH